MSDIITPIVAATNSDEAQQSIELLDNKQLSIELLDNKQQSTELLDNRQQSSELLENKQQSIELLDGNNRPVRKPRASTKPSLTSSRLEHLKISTIRQHYYPEGGWGWVVVGCAFVINLLTMGLLLSYGILYREVVAEFGEEYADQASNEFEINSFRGN
ncbi:hypothetical protein JTE90_023374 [Oedothorax gibbosus]|uniref:Uncharacterized protein n=1 Tax=Oedothorax gibbosus TaxID=931172 RepID=A0AAV6UZH6_9ARAC|nr:hypothetical protein JTE90_023374 [Oedothorax gibbosus]